MDKTLSGVLCMNKPSGFTSFDVVGKLRGILKTKRIGHAGTLDPMATGVLPIFVGSATRVCDILPDSDKTYVAEFQLGLTTTTLDSSGATLETRGCAGVTTTMVEESLDAFRGDILQIPPMYSAVSINGQRLYDLARQGIEVERPARPVTIRSLTLLEFDSSHGSGRIEVSCSAGTYIRTLIADMGEALAYGGIMTGLVRTKAAGFTLSECVGFEELIALCGDFSTVLHKTEELFSVLKKITLDEIQTPMYKNGVKLDLNRVTFCGEDARVAVYGADGIFLGTAFPNREKGELICEKNLF